MSFSFTQTMSNFYRKRPKGVVCVCGSCGEEYGSSGGRCAMYCKLCRTASARKELAENNKALREKQNEKARPE